MTDTPTPDSLRPGSLVGPWRVEGYGGRGTYGVVYRARRAGHPGSLPVALKVAVFPHDPRFGREVELLSRVRHPGVPRLVDRGWWHAGEGEVHPYLVMEWIRGLPLYEWARVHSATQRQVLRVVAQVAWGLEVLHRAGGLHRDVKGDNILVEPEGRALLTDFGLGTWAGAHPITDRTIPPGTPEYRSPEALRFQWEHWREKGARYEARPSDDIYGLGVSLYRLVTGGYPPPGTDPEARESPERTPLPTRVPVRERDARLIPGLAELIERMLTRQPEARGMARELAAAAESVAEHAGPEADVPIFGPERLPSETESAHVRWERHAPVLEQPASEGSREPSRESPPCSTPPAPSWDAWPLLAIAALVLVAVAIGWGSREPQDDASELARAEPVRDEAAPDAGTRGLGDATPTARVAAEGLPAGLEVRVIAMDLPEKPIPGQRRAPCRGHEQVEINGGCWHLLTNTFPPCGEDAYEWKRACYYPILERAKPRTSKKPR
ncbi:serine/threonine protein kinase [Hyalangium gracile]|uniref:serine/threonine protein kinase n=1 Tax=Hyalangium gracile TaxID=394092 RepID=UPI001CCBDBF4|nr:serine/threonine-protein kinase [Hyalangium gracile]